MFVSNMLHLQWSHFVQYNLVVKSGDMRIYNFCRCKRDFSDEHIDNSSIKHMSFLKDMKLNASLNLILGKPERFIETELK